MASRTLLRAPSQPTSKYAVSFLRFAFVIERGSDEVALLLRRNEGGVVFDDATSAMQFLGKQVLREFWGTMATKE